VVWLWVAGAALVAGCGYHISGGGAIPQAVKTIAITPFANATMSYAVARLIPEDLTQEFHARTHYVIVADPQQADAVLQGSVVNMGAFPTVSDPVTGRATAVQVEVTISVKLTDRRSGATLFSSNGVKYRERYEVALDPTQYFDESSTAARRLSRDVARDILSSILEKF
jgi:outer membrane lipopolysaccharide assembly protein LptE/RlpB